MADKKLIFCLIFILCNPLFSSSENGLPARINTIRQQHGLSLLNNDPLLSRTAENYCKELYFFGRLSHKDQYGNNALERYRRMHGTAVTVGEILGAGDNENKILLSWMESKDHKEVILHKDWTHYGYGIHTVENTKILVILFTQKLIPDLTIIRTASQIVITGHLTIPGIIQVMIKINSEKILPEIFNKNENLFQFILLPENIPPCLELGYINNSQIFTITDIIYPFKY